MGPYNEYAYRLYINTFQWFDIATTCSATEHLDNGEYMSFNIDINNLYTAHFAHKYGNSGEIVCRISDFNTHQFRLFGMNLDPYTGSVTIPNLSDAYTFIGFILCI